MNKTNEKAIAARIVLLRGRLGLSQKAFAELIGRSVSFMNKVENGHSSISDQLVATISSTFSVAADWLEKGIGLLVIESIGDRFRVARKSHDYTQEELAAELKVSRNSVGMIERGEMRPNEEVITALCDLLWINKNWLLTGTGNMERTELTPVYSMLRVDPTLRVHMRAFLDHLERGPRRRSAEKEEAVQEPEVWTTAYGINDLIQARLFFDYYHIPYQEEENGGLKIQKARHVDWEHQRDIEERCRRARIPQITDHPQAFIDQDGNTVVCFAPYDVEETELPWIEKSPYNFYGYGTTMFVVRC